MKAQELERVIKQDGWQLVRQTGGHRIYRHPDKPGTIVIPWHSKDIPTGTAHNILKQAGLKLK